MDTTTKCMKNAGHICAAFDLPRNIVGYGYPVLVPMQEVISPISDFTW